LPLTGHASSCGGRLLFNSRGTKALAVDRFYRLVALTSFPLAIFGAQQIMTSFRFNAPSSTSGSRTVLRPNFSARRVSSNPLVLVGNQHPPAPAHDGKGLGEVIDESSDGRQHAPGRREDQVDDALWRAPLRQDVDERAAAHVLHAAVLGQQCDAEPGERGGAQLAT
jgi:hypothetical protein